jgi:hypothetical protein
MGRVFRRHTHEPTGGGSGSSGDGMDMTTSTVFLPTNEYISKVFWILVATIVAIGVLSNVVSRIDVYLRYSSFRLQRASS